ncbi:MAG TPA: EAL domain-containing protein [Terriglobales bacterium]|nr:EAL domain-containing protein [Terriglobales bacterium]
MDAILDPARLSICFQPIFRISDQRNVVRSLEALVRGPRHTNFERADVLFDYVRRKKAEHAMDRTCLSVAFKEAMELPAHLSLNVNVHATTLAQKAGFANFLLNLASRHSLAPNRIVVEIVEHAPACHVPSLNASLAVLREAGIRIALDDVGLGQSNYRMMVDCHPEYFKLDSYFVRGLKNDSRRLAVVESVATLATSIGSAVVAEGVESKEDIALLARMGVEFVQANLLCAALPISRLREAGYLAPAKAPAEADAGSSASWKEARKVRAAVAK